MAANDDCLRIADAFAQQNRAPDVCGARLAGSAVALDERSLGPLLRIEGRLVIGPALVLPHQVLPGSPGAGSSRLMRHTNEVSSALQSDAAVSLARAALEADEGAAVGAHVASTVEDEFAVAHYFEADLPAYRGWQWCAVVAATPGGELTISETALLPGPTSLTPPQWVPWDQRVLPGDLGPGDILPPQHNDVRIEPGYVLTGDPAVDEVAGEIGLNLERVMSREGKLATAQRWLDSDFGPDSEMAQATGFDCGDCAFYLPLAGSLGVAFGVCGNEFSADAHVVHSHYGCGADSSAEGTTGQGSPAFEPYDDGAVEAVERVSAERV